MGPPGGVRRKPLRVGVIGAGIGGIGVALELASRGVSVDLHERTDRLHARASLANEGKIHLGYIYANDPSLRTAKQMAEGSWRFSPILRDWLEHDLDERLRSGATHYLVHRDSLLEPDAIDVAYGRIAGLHRELADRPDASYFGLEGSRPPRLLPVAEREQHFGPAIAAAYDTPEIAVDTEAVGNALSQRVLDDPSIMLSRGSHVVAAEPDADGVSLTAVRDGTEEVIRYDHVVNASWEDLLRIDETAGLAAPDGSSFRRRHVVRIRAPHAGRRLPSASIVLGAFGDVVQFGSGDVFLSWYPVGRRGISVSLSPPAEWLDEPAEAVSADVRSRTFASLAELVPALETVAGTAVTAATVRAGVVYARGTTDIDDAGSGYHRRDAIGPRSVGRYHSLDTGKYTTAPLFARNLAAHISS